jgi:polyferredoxin
MSLPERIQSADAAARALTAVRALHTTIWGFFASSIVAIPIATQLGEFTAALWMSLFVWGEVGVLLLNGMRCPLTTLAARYTDDRTDNFDIYLPRWLARHNQLIFGTAFAGSQALLLRALLAG